MNISEEKLINIFCLKVSCIIPLIWFILCNPIYMKPIYSINYLILSDSDNLRLKVVIIIDTKLKLSVFLWGFVITMRN